MTTISSALDQDLDYVRVVGILATPVAVWAVTTAPEGFRAYPDESYLQATGMVCVVGKTEAEVRNAARGER
jgi:hypothetical protein